jgi:hypothetical protein
VGLNMVVHRSQSLTQHDPCHVVLITMSSLGLLHLISSVAGLKLQGMFGSRRALREALSVDILETQDAM